MAPRTRRSFAGAAGTAAAAAALLGLFANAETIRRSSGSNLRQKLLSPSFLGEQGTGSTVDAYGATTPCLQAINDIRAIYHLEPLVAQSQARTNQLEEAAKNLVKKAAIEGTGDEAKCPNSAKSSPSVVAGESGGDGALHFVLPFGKDVPGENGEDQSQQKTELCKQLVTDEYKLGVQQLEKVADLKPDQTYTAGTGPFEARASQNLPILLDAASKQIGCAWTHNCDSNQNLLLCTLTPTLTNNTSQAFSSEVYHALVKTTSAARLTETLAAAVVSLAAVLFI